MPAVARLCSQRCHSCCMPPSAWRLYQLHHLRVLQHLTRKQNTNCTTCTHCNTNTQANPHDMLLAAMHTQAARRIGGTRDARVRRGSNLLPRGCGLPWVQLCLQGCCLGHTTHSNAGRCYCTRTQSEWRWGWLTRNEVLGAYLHSLLWLGCPMLQCSNTALQVYIEFMTVPPAHLCLRARARVCVCVCVCV